MAFILIFISIQGKVISDLQYKTKKSQKKPNLKDDHKFGFTFISIKGKRLFKIQAHRVECRYYTEESKNTPPKRAGNLF